MALKTLEYAGEYDYRKDIEKGPTGYISIFPETDTTVLFYKSLNRGAPTYNMGELFGRLKFSDRKATYSSSPDSSQTSCTWMVESKTGKLIITTVNDRDNCEFGFHVYIDGTYNRRSRKIPYYFIDLEGKKYYFKKTKPENWNHNVD